MQNSLFLGFGNRAIGADFTSAGSFQSNCGPDKLGNPQPADHMQTTDTSNVTVNFDMGAVVPIRLLALIGDNLDGVGTIAWCFGSTSGATDIYDSGDELRWKFEPHGGYAWGEETNGNPFDALKCLPEEISARYGSIVLKNTTNSAGFLRAGMIWVSDGETFDTGAVQEGFVPETKELKISNESDSGADYGEVMRRWQEQKLVLPLLTSTERDRMRDILLRYGTSGQLIFMPHIGNPVLNQRYGFIGKFRELNSIEFPGSRFARLPLAIKKLT